ncbi:uncharacterized protein LOC114366173 [Ostrinia furnacalis]|uniref:uncharacterized protein LOC114356045 n=1 Tax=Ostrinia furnacalis TaxID=93504 RepID=UPI00103B5DC7|nr:uncharacterized protein LOC114356045 [Ostrinia furnacalis]XP_028178751.1 uncharacterized protein LOC114366173 [Ostrinia furnacalis]
MEGSPFNRSALTQRSPPPTPTQQAPPAAPVMEPLEVVATSELQNWMKSIEQCLNEVCIISSEGKLNTDQKLRISNLCRRVSNGTSQMAVQYQSLKQKAIQAHSNIQVLKESQDISQQLQDLKKSIEVTSKPISGAFSFADMVKKSPVNFIQPKNFSSVAIYPNDKMKSSEETKSLVQKIIKPEEMKLHVRGLRKTRDGGVIISTNSKDDIEKIKQSTQLRTSGLIIDETKKRKPRIIVLGVPASMDETEVFKCIYHQNLADKLQNTSLEAFMSSIKLSHKSGRKDTETCNYVIEVTAQIRKTLIANDRVFVNWSSCPVRDFTLVTRCYKCQQYGHAAKTCREANITCGHCGEVGHVLKDCNKKDEPSKCATCLHFKKPNNHKTGDAECPAKKLAEQRYINTIDYEGA